MVVVEDIINEALGTYVRDWFEPGFTHAFLDLQANVVSDDLKPIPKNWVDEVELEVDGDMRELQEDDFDSNVRVKKGSFTPGQCKTKLQQALERLGLDETSVMAPGVKTFGKQQLYQEKQRVKQELKRFDSEFHKQADRWPTHCEKECMRPLYIYHRRLKTLIECSEGRSAPLGVLWETSGQPISGAIMEDDRPAGHRHNFIGNGMPSEMQSRMHALQKQKDSVRKRLQSYQGRFVAENNRPIKYHKDILPIEREYKIYKAAKAEMSKLEAQMRDMSRR